MANADKLYITIKNYLKSSVAKPVSEQKVYGSLNLEIDRALSMGKVLTKKVQIIRLFVESDPYLESEPKSRLIDNLNIMEDNINRTCWTVNELKVKVNESGVDSIVTANSIIRYVSEARDTLRLWNNKVVTINIPLTTLNTYDRYLVSMGSSCDRELTMLIQKNTAMTANALFKWYKNRVDKILSELGNRDTEINKKERSVLNSLIQSEKDRARKAQEEAEAMKNIRTAAKKQADRAEKRRYASYGWYKTSNKLQIIEKDISVLEREIATIVGEPEISIKDAQENYRSKFMYKSNMVDILKKLRRYIRGGLECPTLYFIVYPIDKCFYEIAWWNGAEFLLRVTDVEVDSISNIAQVKNKMVERISKCCNKNDTCLYAFGLTECIKLHPEFAGNKILWKQKIIKIKEKG